MAIDSKGSPGKFKLGYIKKTTNPLLLIFQTWDVAQKKNPHMVKKAGTWSEEAMFWIMKFEPANQKELLMQTCAVLNVVTTQRQETLQQYLCVDVTVEPATAEFPRCLQF